jgi:hypothetical protein
MMILPANPKEDVAEACCFKINEERLIPAILNDAEVVNVTA